MENKTVKIEIKKFCKEYGLDFSKVQMDSDGLWSYNGDIYFSNNEDFKEFPKCFNNLKEIKGSLNCANTSITYFKGLENLKTIGENLDCSWTSIKSFEGLENLQSIVGCLDCYWSSLEIFKGLENLQTIGENLDCSYTNIKDFKGLENLKIDINKFYPEERREEFLKFQKSLENVKEQKQPEKDLNVGLRFYPEERRGNILKLQESLENVKEQKQPEKDLNVGLRFNQGKTRHDLIPIFAQEQYAKVLTKGAEKYADRNWERGMEWNKVIASLKRHLQAFESGEDFDQETGLLHTAHIMTNAGFLTEYYKIYPQGDNRPHNYLKLNRFKIGLDIDEVLADFVKHWSDYYKIEIPQFWNFDLNFQKRIEELKNDKDFWMTIPIKTNPKDIPFEPHCYITSRPIPKEWTEEWLSLNGFPSVPVYSIGYNGDKVKIAKEANIDIFVDDRFENFAELNNAGICCFLFNARHNEKYNVGFKRIKSLSELRY